MIIRILTATLALFAWSAVSAFAEDVVEVTGGTFKYPLTIEVTSGSKKIPMKLTGAAMRKKAIFNVYTIGSYIQADARVTSAEELASADVLKQLHLVMERTVSGKEMATAFHDAIRANYPTEFSEDLDKFMELMRAQTAEKGDHVWITHIPGVGIHVNLVGKKAETIRNPKFSKAVWDIYLGPKNVGEAVKKGLTARLDK
ncbi:MAG TPA: chalcone isomerase family protein [Gemmataceae bacterium]|nr:chalcone isomerase family protein [Gemmataceae bacterium]